MTEAEVDESKITSSVLVESVMSSVKGVKED